MTDNEMQARARSRLTAALLVLIACLLGAQHAYALPPVNVETSEGVFTIELFDFPDVEDHARFFIATEAPKLTNAFFHRGDKLFTCDRDPTPEWCFACVCTAGLCELDPNNRTCEPEQEGTTFWLIDDQSQPAPYLQAGRFRLDALYDIEELADDMPPELSGPVESEPVFANNAFTVAFVRVEEDDGMGMGGTTTRLTSEWIINLEDNPELNDPFGNDPSEFSEAYYVVGAVSLGREVVSLIGGQNTYDAVSDPNVPPTVTLDELEQVPVFDSFSGEPGNGDPFIDPCEDETVEPDDTVCRTPACVTETLEQLACEDPRCIALIPLTEEEQELVDDGIFVQRFCTAPELPAFPVIVVPEPGLTGLATGLLALAALARRRRS